MSLSFNGTTSAESVTAVGCLHAQERAPLPLSQLSALVTGSLLNGEVTASPCSKEGKEARQAQLLAEVQHFLTSMGQVGMCMEFVVLLALMAGLHDNACLTSIHSNCVPHTRGWLATSGKQCSATHDTTHCAL